MYIRYFFLFIIFNMVLGVSAIGMHPIDAVAQGSNLGNPLYLGGCYWDGTTTIAQTIDPVEYGDPSTDISDTLGELTYPTNSTSTSSGPTGDGNIINSITDFTEATGKTIETIKNFMGGTYVIDVISNVAIGCDVVYETQGGSNDDDCPAGYDIGDWCMVKQSNVVWDYFVNGFTTVIAFAVIICIVQIVRPFNTGSASL